MQFIDGGATLNFMKNLVIKPPSIYSFYPTEKEVLEYQEQYKVYKLFQQQSLPEHKGMALQYISKATGNFVRGLVHYKNNDIVQFTNWVLKEQRKTINLVNDAGGVSEVNAMAENFFNKLDDVNYALVKYNIILKEISGKDDVALDESYVCCSM